NRLADHLFRSCFKNFPGRNFSQTAWIKSVPPVEFFIELFARQFNLVGIANDDVVSTQEKRGVLRPMLPRSNVGCFGLDASKYLVGCVDHFPFPDRPPP